MEKFLIAVILWLPVEYSECETIFRHEFNRAYINNRMFLAVCQVSTHENYQESLLFRVDQNVVS